MKYRFLGLVLALLVAAPALAAPPAAEPFNGNVIFASAARTADATSAWYSGTNCYGGVFVVDSTAAGGATVVTVIVEGWDEASNSAFTYQTYSTTFSGVVRMRYGLFFAGATTATSGLNQMFVAPLPQIFRIKMDHDIATSITYSVFGFPVKAN